MNIKFLVLEKFSKILFGFLSLFFLLCLSCGYNAQSEDLSKSIQSNTNNNSQNSEPVLTVKKFMEHISENELEKANNLVKIEQEVLETSKPKQEMPTKLDWAQVFKERNLSLEKIVSSSISGKNAEVKTLLIHKDDARIKMTGDFSLISINGQWFITDIEFITGMNKY